VIPEGISRAVMEFALRCGEVPNLEAAVLFGSAVDGTFSKKSDIDVLLLFDTDGNPELGPEAEAVHSLAGDISAALSLSHPFSFVMYSRRETVDGSLLREVLRDGVVLFARPRDVLGAARDDLRPHVLFSYTLKGMAPRDKMALQRGLYGYRVARRVGDRRYDSASPGLVGRWGRRVGPTAFLVPEERAREARELLGGRGCAFEEVPVWLEAGL
jgi:predicted nucleotidyltransferase